MTTITSLRIRRPDDMHVHLREGKIMKEVLPHTASVFGRALVMPNLKEPVLTRGDAAAYKRAIRQELDSQKSGEPQRFQPLMTLKLTKRTEPLDMHTAKEAGVVAVKLYPEGVTTNSADGISDVEALYPVFEAMQACGMVLSIHAESPHAFCLERERDFVEAYLPSLLEFFPRLKVVIEHVSTAHAVDFVFNAPTKNLAATITAHHLLLTLDDVVGGMLSPHNFCKPVAKRPEDREAVLRAATSGSSKFFFGSDSAPHTRDTKEWRAGCAGCFTAPVALPLLTQIFEERGAIEKLEPFTSVHGAEFYGLPLNADEITLHRETWMVPESYENIVPFWSGRTLPWRVAERP